MRWHLFAAAVILSASPVLAHDQHTMHDSWYQSLTRPGDSSRGCCNKTDCHTTEAEIRAGDWWARVGKPNDTYAADDGGRIQVVKRWDLLGWVKVPDSTILRGKNNPTGEAVICHELPGASGGFSAATAEVFCFVPPNEY